MKFESNSVLFDVCFQGSGLTLDSWYNFRISSSDLERQSEVFNSSTVIVYEHFLIVILNVFHVCYWDNCCLVKPSTTPLLNWSSNFDVKSTSSFCTVSILAFILIAGQNEKYPNCLVDLLILVFANYPVQPKHIDWRGFKSSWPILSKASRAISSLFDRFPRQVLGVWAGLLPTQVFDTNIH